MNFVSIDMVETLMTETDVEELEQPATKERHKSGLWITDAELIRRSGIPEKKYRPVLRVLDADKNSGFPKKNKLHGDLRYWPAVQAYWARINGLSPQEDRRSA